MSNQDLESAVLYYKNLKDKMADGNIELTHCFLLLRSHNIHGMRVFSLDPLHTLLDSSSSKLLLPEVLAYEAAKHHAFRQEYPFLAGNTLAHEIAADNMLKKFKDAFFTPYLGFYKPEEYEKILKFFEVHEACKEEEIGVEQQHAEMAIMAIKNICERSLEDIPEIIAGANLFLDSQAKLWDGMLRELEKAQFAGEVIPIREAKCKETEQTTACLKIDSATKLSESKGKSK